MPPRSLLRAFLGMWIITGVALLVGGVETARQAWTGAPQVNPHLVVLGTIEAAAALLFVLPITLRLGAAGLLLTIGVAFLFHLGLGQFRGDLLVYGAAVLFVRVHGPLTRPQWRTAMSRPAV